jgi:aspartate ammonia-lyase
MSPSNPKNLTRTERDALGELEIPADAFYGVQTARAIQNFPISGWKPFDSLIIATIRVKKAAVRANRALGAIDPQIGYAIEAACDEVLRGHLLDQFVVDPFQAGAGTSHNMNANEVLANRAIELLGGVKGDYSIVHPNDHVNMGQSTNDVFPTAMRLASLEESTRLSQSLTGLEGAFQKKASEFDGVIKSGRTHLQDAVPVRLGQEFGAYAEAIRKGLGRLEAAASEMTEIGLGGTAVGTGLNTAPGYRERVVRELADLMNLALARDSGLHATGNYFESMQSMSPFVHLSSVLKTIATDLIRICGDLRLLASGPNTGLAEINLPAVQPGSSIMPGKVNPVMAEMTTMVCYQAIGNDAAVVSAAQAGQLELNVMMPVIAFNLLLSLRLLKNAIDLLRARCVEGITANEARCRWYTEHSLALVTALSPRLGYSRAAELAKEAVRTGRTIREVMVQSGMFTDSEADQLLDSRAMTEYQTQ